MKKKVLFFLFIFLLIGGIGLYWFEIRQSPEISAELSDRAKEYLAGRQTNTQTSLKNVAIVPDGATGVPERQMVTGGDCYRITVPFPVRDIKYRENCLASIAIERPKGRVVVYMEKIAKIGLENASGVSMRRMYPDKYEEDSVKLGNRTFHIFTNKESEAYEKTVYFIQPSYHLILTLTAYGADNIEPKLYDMLSSLEILY
jgi:hypothetical protein